MSCILFQCSCNTHTITIKKFESLHSQKYEEDASKKKTTNAAAHEKNDSDPAKCLGVLEFLIVVTVTGLHNFFVVVRSLFRLSRKLRARIIERQDRSESKRIEMRLHGTSRVAEKTHVNNVYEWRQQLQAKRFRWRKRRTLKRKERKKIKINKITQIIYYLYGWSYMCERQQYCAHYDFDVFASYNSVDCVSLFLIAPVFPLVFSSFWRSSFVGFVNFWIPILRPRNSCAAAAAAALDARSFR